MAEDRSNNLTDAERQAAAQKLLASWSSAAMTHANEIAHGDFATEIGEIAFNNIFSGLWVRPQLDLRARSLVTLGILIALRYDTELRVHTIAALRNGCTVQELEEVIYHASAYAGYPAANTARRIIIETLRAEGLIE